MKGPGQGPGPSDAEARGERGDPDGAEAATAIVATTAASSEAGAAGATLTAADATGVAEPMLEPPGTQPGWLARIGLAIGHPRWALAIAADRRHAGRSGADLIAAILVLLLATQLRGLATAVWLGFEVAPGFGVRAAMRVLTGALTIDLVLLLIGALALFAAAGPRRNLGRAFDVACVAALPLVVVDLVATVAVRAGDVSVPPALSWLLAGVAYAWMGSLIAMGIRPARSLARTPSPPAAAVRTARRIGGAAALVVAAGVALQGVWIADHLDLVKPMSAGEPAPAIALQRIDAGGKLGDRVTLEASRGKVIVLDFWATWCKPCLAAMPRLDEIARAHSDVSVIAINLDDAAASRALFERYRWAMTLVADDGDASERYGVSSIPHTVILDRRGVVRQVIRGARSDLGAIVEAIRTSEPAPSKPGT